MDDIMSQTLQRLNEKVKRVPWEKLKDARADSLIINDPGNNISGLSAKQLIADAINSCHTLESLMKTY
jgi:hypothetical protein